MLGRSDLRLQAILLTMVSSGVRLGAWDYLDWGHAEPIYKGKRLIAAKLRVYVGEPEEYLTFTTPKAHKKLEEYITYRKQWVIVQPQLWSSLALRN